MKYIMLLPVSNIVIVKLFFFFHIIAHYRQLIDFRRTNTAWVRARLCKLQKKCTRLAAASDKVYQLLVHGWWFSLGTPASSTTKTGCHDIAEILLKVALKHQKSKIKSIQTNSLKYIAEHCMLFSYQTGYIMWHSRLRIYIPWREYIS